MVALHPKRAVALISGGLDSTLAAKLMLNQGIELIGLYLSAPWGCCDVAKAAKTARMLGIEFRIEKMTQDYLDVIRNPKYGYGSSMNPCIDCRIYMFSKAGQLMESWGASFMVTGEVLGQRPMSQMSQALRIIERDAGLQRRVLRPLSALAMAPTIPEEEGIVDRSKLLGITGRSRKPQMELAKALGILEYPSPAGGCLLTDQEFGNRVRDLFEHQEAIGLDDMELLRLGRHFRLTPQTKVIVGRNEGENRTLEQYLTDTSALLVPEGFPGPSALIVGAVTEQAKQLAVQAIVRYSKPEKLAGGAVTCRQAAVTETLSLSLTPASEVPALEPLRV